MTIGTHTCMPKAQGPPTLAVPKPGVHIRVRVHAKKDKQKKKREKREKGTRDASRL